MKARIVKHEKVNDELGNTVEIKVWRVPISKDKPHGYKYSLAYIVDDERVIGYDNHERRGDHRHHGKREEPYRFVNLRKLARDFYRDILRYKEGTL